MTEVSPASRPLHKRCGEEPRDEDFLGLNRQGENEHWEKKQNLDPLLVGDDAGADDVAENRRRRPDEELWQARLCPPRGWHTRKARHAYRSALVHCREEQLFEKETLNELPS